jgi:hypothetical protein
MIGFVLVRLLYRVSVQVFGSSSLTCDDGAGDRGVAGASS